MSGPSGQARLLDLSLLNNGTVLTLDNSVDNVSNRLGGRTINTAGSGFSAQAVSGALAATVAQRRHPRT